MLVVSSLDLNKCLGNNVCLQSFRREIVMLR